MCRLPDLGSDYALVGAKREKDILELLDGNPLGWIDLPVGPFFVGLTGIRGRQHDQLTLLVSDMLSTESNYVA